MANDDRIKRIGERQRTERKRVDGILQRDRLDEYEDWMRNQANIEIEDGKYFNLQDTVIGPTREQLANAQYVHFTPRGRDGTVRSVKGYRKVNQSTVLRMHNKGHISDEGFSACLWYARKYEQAGLEGAVGSVDYGREVFTPPQNRTAFTEWQEEAQNQLRSVKKEIPSAFVKFFENIVVHNIPLHRAKRSCRIRSDRALPKFREMTEHAYQAVKVIDPDFGEKK